MMMLHRSASESAFSRTHRAQAQVGLDREDASTQEEDEETRALTSTPSIRTLPGRSSFTTPPRRFNSLRAQEPSESTPSSSTSRLAGGQNRKPSSASSSELQKQHRALGKAVSQQTMFSGSSNTAFSKTAWASENSVDIADGRRNSKKISKSCKRQLVLPPSPSDEGQDGCEPIYFSARESGSSAKSPDQNSSKPVSDSPSSPGAKARMQDGPRSPGTHLDSPKRHHSSNKYRPHNEKFPIPNSPYSPKSPTARSPEPLRDDVFDYTSPSQVELSNKSSRDRRPPEKSVSTPATGRGRKTSREVLLEFPPESNTNTRPLGRLAQQTERAKDERREKGQGRNYQNHQVVRAAQSVPRLDTERTTTPTNSPDRSTRPHSVVDTRERQRQKPNKSKMCDFFFFLRWGKKKDKRHPSGDEDGTAKKDRSRGRGKTSGHRSRSDNSTSPSASPDKRERDRSRSKSKDKRPASSSNDHHHRHHRSHHRDGDDRHHHHRPSSSSASRPLRTPTTGGGGQSSEPQYRQYRHHHRREQQHHYHKKQHHSPDENRPPPQQYTPSRQKRERPKKHQHRRDRNNGKPATDDGRSLVSDGTVGLRHEDLPLHPSIAKALVSKTPKSANSKSTPPVTGSYQKNTFVRAPGTGGPDPLRRGWKRSRSESPSNLRPSTGNSGSNTNLSGVGEEEEGREELRERSLHSASRTDIDSNFHYTVSSADQRRPSVPRDAGMNRSRSFPGFEPSSHSNAHYFNPDADTKVITDAEDFEYKPTDMSGPVHLSFCGCGFVGMYHLGVVSCLLARGETFLEHVEKVAGSSAGALMAAVMLCAPDKIEEIGEQLQALARELRSRPLGALTPGYSFARALRLMLDDVLPEDAHLLVSGKLHISLTAAAGQGGGDGGKKKSSSNELMSDFNTREELIEALVASSYIPLYAGFKMPVIRGKKYMDGCFSDNLPSFPHGRTITVSPFDGRSDIAPKAGQEAQKKAHFISLLNQEYQMNTRNMKKGAHMFFPPKRHVLQEYFNLGRFDASRFLIREGLYTIKLVQSSEKAVYVSSV